MNELLALPWQIQVVIVGGYFAYVIAYSGKRSAHKSIDTLSIILCFGGIGLLTFNFIDQVIPNLLVVWSIDISYLREFILAAGAISGALLSALVWRRFLGQRLGKVLRNLGKSEDNGLFSGWETLIQEPNLAYSQLNVYLKDGRMLESYPLSRFYKYPNGSCILGGDGSVAMYVTHIESAQGGRRETMNLDCEIEGPRMTSIPADQIAEIDMRRKPIKGDTS
ncbi:hypothetical protein K7H22_10080 [Seohaeicola saemankumensis]|uniref:hypothetical protein n=1 Tax=Seohaeicola saemankumensis TaxID=481181 RepID=UPI001E42A4AC|nr:hypothetical protein [Seohaeicola saemankumensis]MCD1626338.1 hypothetical protein [Seohaeicola saemankumensis]